MAIIQDREEPRHAVGEDEEPAEKRDETICARISAIEIFIGVAGVAFYRANLHLQSRA